MSHGLVLSSGYLYFPTCDNKGFVQNVNTPNTFIDVFLNKSYLDRGNDYFYNNEADELYKVLLKNDNSVKDIDIHVRTILLFKKLFSDTGFLPWIELQRNGYLFTASHIDFLRNTLEFISKGRRRALDTGTWRSMLLPNMGDEITLRTVERCVDELIRDYKDLNINVIDLLVTWINKPGGYLDLISTMYVIFGSREPQADFIQ